MVSSLENPPTESQKTTSPKQAPIEGSGASLPESSVTDIMNVIPHRYPFLLVDKVTHHIQGQYIEGYKNVTFNEPFFQGHFPNRPIMPGVLQVEALAQLGAILVGHMPGGKGKLAVLAGIDDVRFRKMVTPGDRLDLYGELVRFRHPVGKSKSWAKVNGETVLECTIIFSLIDEEN